ncbi:putative mannan endo-1 like protein [Verticillium longisporum]|uniref:Putative mannan endo-1 like protein n=1 Tax=Verticillium longisporum TaxID=100787 RepID=A0A8I2ZLA1_VERLO|nr:putative mannan endo-1 like protein [Verticillium longisporum]
MVAWVGGLAARAGAVFVMSSRPGTQHANLTTYTINSMAAIDALQSTWYNVQSGIWDRKWWNSANVFTTLADFASIDVVAANALNIGGIMRNTFEQAQKEAITSLKLIDDTGLVTSSYTISMVGMEDASTEVATKLISRQFPGFINEFYDDEGWWALALIRAFDVTRDQGYLDMAANIFDDMKTGGNTNCNGGIYWNKERKYVNAISNELYLSVAASLANRMPNRQAYLDIAAAQWVWFKASGMINERGTINDGLDGSCRNNGQNTWSYNQGVILGGLVELNKATGDANLLSDAAIIAKAAIKELSDDKGILHDTCEPNCGADGEQFKGIFVRNLHYLHKAAPDAAYRKFILNNADSNWARNWDKANKMGVNWAGPIQRVSGGAALKLAILQRSGVAFRGSIAVATL